MRNMDWTHGVKESLEVLGARIRGQKEVSAALEQVVAGALQDLTDMRAPSTTPQPVPLEASRGDSPRSEDPALGHSGPTRAEPVGRQPPAADPPEGPEPRWRWPPGLAAA